MHAQKLCRAASIIAIQVRAANGMVTVVQTKTTDAIAEGRLI
jgi:hypothetical protein